MLFFFFYFFFFLNNKLHYFDRIWVIHFYQKKSEIFSQVTVYRVTDRWKQFAESISIRTSIVRMVPVLGVHFNHHCTHWLLLFHYRRVIRTVRKHRFVIVIFILLHLWNECDFERCLTMSHETSKIAEIFLNPLTAYDELTRHHKNVFQHVRRKYDPDDGSSSWNFESDTRKFKRDRSLLFLRS